VDLQGYASGHIKAFLLNYDILLRDLAEVAAAWPMLAYLTEVQHRQLAALAKAWGVSKAQLIRDGVNLLLRQAASQGRDPLLDLVGQAGPVGRQDIAAQHDAFQATLVHDTERTSPMPGHTICAHTRMGGR